MDPVLELSTLTASYLWALREVFPDCEVVGAIPIDELLKQVYRPLPTEDDGHDTPKIFDFALCTRLKDIAERKDGEHWKRRAPAKLRERIAGADALETVYYQRELEKATRAQGYFESVRTTWTQKLEPRNYEDLAKEQLEDFTKHTKTLIAVLPDQPLGGNSRRDPSKPITRERLAQDVHCSLLSKPEERVKLAEELDYVPVLLRGFENDASIWRAVLVDADYPKLLVAKCVGKGLALPFSLVLHEELAEINLVRKLRKQGRPESTKYAPTLDRAFDANLLGLALSGGGIRSATFNLGVLQGLANKQWLPRIDYLSTVSGGGYIGAWFISWIKRRGSLTSVEESLRGHALPPPARAAEATHSLFPPPPPPPVTVDPGAEHVRPIRLLREYSNYLTPLVGAFSADTWTMLSIWIRNTALNLIVLSLFLMAILLLPRLLGWVYLMANGVWCFLAAAGSLGMAAWFSGKNLQTFSRKAEGSDERGDTPFVVVMSIVLPVMMAAVFAAQALWFAGYSNVSRTSIFGQSSVLLAVTLMITATRSGDPRIRAESVSRWERLMRRVRAAPSSFLWCTIAGAAAGALISAIYELAVPFLLQETRRGIWLDLAFGPLVMLAVLGFVITLYLGLEGLALHDERREWWSRLGAWLALVGICWAIVATISYFAPYTVAALATAQAGALGVAWSTITAVGAWLAQSGKSNGINLPFDKNVVSSAAIQLSPFLFIAGYLVLLAIFTHALMVILPVLLNARQLHSTLDPLPFSLDRYVATYWAFMDPNPLWPAGLAVMLLAVAWGVAMRVDVNEFSMHHFYKNRLVRAYLGASRSRLHRRPNAFTGLDMRDDIKLWRFRCTDGSLPSDEWTNCRAGYSGPFPIINTTLNMTAGDELAWQERKGQSFVFTPLYCGYDFATKQTLVSKTVAAQFGFRPTEQFAAGADDAGVIGALHRAVTPGDDNRGLGIGTAVAISGAAANPNAGYHTSPGVAFLLTIFNARLGWWIGNPRFGKWKIPSPTSGLFYLLSELFGFSGVDRKFVQLSDGGHFDNMGLYELVRRRCKFIIVCDAEQDNKHSLNGLAGAIRKCRVDFGVVIDLPIDRVKKFDENGLSDAHTAIGTIAYPGQDGVGRIVYVKASLTGDEPVDVLEYRARNEEFPHQTTADQFFDESQFESYRALGQHIIDCAFPAWDTDKVTETDDGLRLDALMRAVATGRRCS